MDQRWDTLFAQVFADFPDKRVVEEAEKALEAMDYRVQQDGSCFDIPRDVSLMIVSRSLHQDERLSSGGFLAFEVAVGPHLTDQGVFNGVCEYGILRLEFGLDGTFQDDFFIISPLLMASETRYEQTPTAYALAEGRQRYKGAEDTTEQENA